MYDDIHRMTETQLDLAIMDLRGQIAHLVEVLHDLGPSHQRHTRLAEKRRQLQEIERELTHRRKLT
jgi:hypothetical protein